MAELEPEIGAHIETEVPARVRLLVEPVVRALGFELVLVEFVQDRGRWVLRLYVDAVVSASPDDDLASGGATPPPAEGAVTLADCKNVSHEVSALLDVEDPLPQAYVLEVSSPGLDRPLVRPADFQRFAGRLARIRTVRPIDGRRTFHGRLLGFEGSDVVMNVEGVGRSRIPYAGIKRARIEYEF